MLWEKSKDFHILPANILAMFVNYIQIESYFLNNCQAQFQSTRTYKRYYETGVGVKFLTDEVAEIMLRPFHCMHLN